MSRKQKQTEALVRYVTRMDRRSGEYNVDISEVFEDLSESSSKTADKITEVIEGVGTSYCVECEKSKMYDESEDEYYCPVHDE